MRSVVLTSLLFAALAQAKDPVPVVIELFTSEGCSSCPPADRLLAELADTQPIHDVDVIVLSEHVDYWNSLGWKDPFSSKAFSDRQGSYASRSGSSDIYTPEAIIDGRFAMVGSSRQSVLKALAESGDKPKADLPLSVKRAGGSVVVEVPAVSDGEVWIAITQDNVSSRVEHGENAGKTLRHVGVVRSLTRMTSTQLTINLDKAWSQDLRVVAFVQAKGSGRILQIAQRKISAEL